MNVAISGPSRAEMPGADSGRAGRSGCARGWPNSGVGIISAEYDLEVRSGIGLFGFSAGGAAALLALMDADVPVAEAAILNAPLSVNDNVRNWEHALHRHFQWDAAARAAADRYDVEQQAGRIADRKPLPALVLTRGGADKSFDPGAGERTTAALRMANRKKNEESRFGIKVLPGLGHNFERDANLTSPAPTPAPARSMPRWRNGSSATW